MWPDSAEDDRNAETNIVDAVLSGHAHSDRYDCAPVIQDRFYHPCNDRADGSQGAIFVVDDFIGSLTNTHKQGVHGGHIEWSIQRPRFPGRHATGIHICTEQDKGR
jgi:hypothetical protein